MFNLTNFQNLYSLNIETQLSLSLSVCDRWMSRFSLYNFPQNFSPRYFSQYFFVNHRIRRSYLAGAFCCVAPQSQTFLFFSCLFQPTIHCHKALHSVRGVFFRRLIFLFILNNVHNWKKINRVYCRLLLLFYMGFFFFPRKFEHNFGQFYFQSKLQTRIYRSSTVNEVGIYTVNHNTRMVIIQCVFAL